MVTPRDCYDAAKGIFPPAIANLPPASNPVALKLAVDAIMVGLAAPLRMCESNFNGLFDAVYTRHFTLLKMLSWALDTGDELNAVRINDAKVQYPQYANLVTVDDFLLAVQEAFALDYADGGEIDLLCAGWGGE
jgi:hypothetical protein